MVGLDGNLYFSNLLSSDSRKDYMCNAQYSAARTILTESAISLTVLPSESNPPGLSDRAPTLTHTHTLSLSLLR